MQVKHQLYLISGSVNNNILGEFVTFIKDIKNDEKFLSLDKT